MMMTTKAMDDFGHSLFWLPWVLCICALNVVAAIACVAYVLHSTHTKDTSDASSTIEIVVDEASQTPTASSLKRIVRQNATMIDVQHPQEETVCGKRKTREHVAFPFARLQPCDRDDVMTQGPRKRRHIARPPLRQRLSFRSRSAGCETSSMSSVTQLPLRRVLSCGAIKTTPQAVHTSIHDQSKTSTVVPASASLEHAPVLREIRLRDVLSSAKAVVLAKLRDAAQNAVDEVLTSIVSFLTYGMLLFVVRQYSAVAVGVSLDLGAFSIEL